MNAVHFGAGNIGRGFIGDLLNNSGYFITFIDVNKPVIDAINKNGSYHFYWIDKGYSRREVTNVAGIALTEGEGQAIKAIEECDLLTTSVWADNLPKIASVVAKGLKQRLTVGNGKINGWTKSGAGSVSWHRFFAFGRRDRIGRANRG